MMEIVCDICGGEGTAYHGERYNVCWKCGGSGLVFVESDEEEIDYESMEQNVINAFLGKPSIKTRSELESENETLRAIIRDCVSLADIMRTGHSEALYREIIAKEQS